MYIVGCITLGKMHVITWMPSELAVGCRHCGRNACLHLHAFCTCSGLFNTGSNASLPLDAFCTCSDLYNTGNHTCLHLEAFCTCSGLYSTSRSACLYLDAFCTCSGLYNTGQNLQKCMSPLVQVSASGGKGQLLIPPEVVDKVLKHKVHGPTGMKGLAGIKNIVEKW